MPDDPSAPQPTPTNYQRTTGGSHLRWKPPTPEHLQEMLPAYEILSILGQGGMGAVYKGRQKSLDRIVAIKILPPEAGEDDMQFVERFKNEARTMAKMNHPAIVHVYDFGETTEGQLYIVMEFIDGTDVAKMIQEKKKLPEDYALAITAHVCDALGYAHTHGVIHRDIKPANILINMEGQVKVADFGLAKATDAGQMGLTKTNMAMGTPDFVAPETLTPGMSIDGRADLYAVGVMLYNMLTGVVPRGAFRMPSVTHQTDARFDKVIGKAMEMDRELRYQTALDLRRDLDVILTTPAAKTGMQTIPAQAALPQKPVGKSPSAPQQRSADAPIRKEPAAKPATGKAAPVPAPKSNAGMIYGIAAAIAVVAVAIFLFSGGGKKPAPAPKAVAETKPEPKKPESKPAVPASKAAASKPVPAATIGASGQEQWVDGLAQWFGGTKTNEDFVRQADGAAKIGQKSNTLVPVPASAPLFRDQAARVRGRFPDKDAGNLRLYVRRTTGAGTKEYFLTPQTSEQRVRLSYDISSSSKFGAVLADFPLPAGFDYDAAHTLELRVVGDLLTASVDGKKLGEKRDTQFADGHPAILAQNVTIESFEYANLDSGGSAPAPASTKPGDVFTFAGHRYQHVKQIKVTWDEAKAAAARLGGHLATITSQAEHDFIAASLKDQLPSGYHLFVGLSREADAKDWRWVTGEPFAFSAWTSKNPDAATKSAAVGAYWRTGSAAKMQVVGWDDLEGTDKTASGFLVEWDDATAQPGDVLTFAGHRYQLVTEKLSWDDANIKAQAMGGHLATISSKGENDWLYGNLVSKLKKIEGDSNSDRCFIGAFNDGVSTDAWQWVTEQPFSVQSWMSRFPNDTSSGSKVATLQGKVWDDVRKTYDPLPFLVEWDDDGSKPVPVASASPLTVPVNLLALVDVKRDAVKGTWELKPEGLILQKGEKEQVLGFPFTPPAEYDFEIEFTLTEGKDAGQILPLPSGAISWKMGASDKGRYFGFGPTIDGKGIRDKTRTAAVIQRPELKLNQRYRSVVEVRQGSLRALMDGEEVVKWSGDLSRLKGDASSKLPNPTYLGINGFGSGMICHKAEVRPPSGSAAAAPVVAPPLTRTVDLLALVDLERDGLKGKWGLNPEGILAQPQKSPDQLLDFKQSAPDEYDFEIEFTVRSGDAVLVQVLPVPGGSVLWRTPRNNVSQQAFYFGGMIHGKKPDDPTRTEALVKRPALNLGQRYRSLVEVRKGSLRALIDGKEVLKWSGDFKHFTIDDKFALPDPTHLGVGSFNTAMIFHKAELRPPSTAIAASALPASAPAMPAVAPAPAPAPPADPRLAQLEAGYQARYDADAQKPFLAAVATLNQSYVANGISRARAAAQAKGSLAEVTALDAEKAAIEKGSGVPAEDPDGTPESLKALRSTYRGALTKITAERDAKAAPLLDLYLKALDVYIAELTKVGKIDEAKQVQTLRDAKAAAPPPSGAGGDKIP